MLALDISDFSLRDRATHLHLRASLYQIVPSACEAAGLAWQDIYHEDRGDGMLLVMPSQVSVELLLGPIAAFLHAGIRHHNRTANAIAQMRMRTAVHAGYLQFDAFGAAGQALIHLFRLVDAQAFKSMLKMHDTDLGLVTSQHVYEEVVQHEPNLIDPLTFQQINVENKETIATAWMWLPSASRLHGRNNASPEAHGHGSTHLRVVNAFPRSCTEAGLE